MAAGGGDRSQAGVIRVGPARKLKTVAEASEVAGDGSVIEVDAGDYHGDVALWTQASLTLRSVGGRVRLLADGAAAQQKAIWIVRGSATVVEGFDFIGCRVPSRNGAGIRFEQGHLSVRDCRFIDNEMGLLTNNDPSAELSVENCEFAHNGRPDGHNHNLYVGRIASLRILGSYLHHGRTGHLLKSRAAVNHVLYNRLSDEAGGHASYELEFPDGGIAYVIGNILHQCRDTENRHIVAFGSEALFWPRNALYLVHNTLVDDLRWTGSWLLMPKGTVEFKAINNLLVGGNRPQWHAGGEVRGNLWVTAADLRDVQTGDYGLRAHAWPRTPVAPAGQVGGESGVPKRSFVTPRGSAALLGPVVMPGARQD